MYTTQLQAGLGQVDATKVLLRLWEPEMSSTSLYVIALESGQFPDMTARRLHNLVAECFTPRYLKQATPAAHYLKRLACVLPNTELLPLFLLYTCRANEVLNDFISKVYWERYGAGYRDVGSEEAKIFLERGLDDGKMVKRWSDSTCRKVAAYLVGCCADYGLLESGMRTRRKILPFRITSALVAYLAYDLHFSGLGDNALLEHPEWALFGLERSEVLEELKRLARRDFLIVQTAGDAIKISWSYSSMEEVCDVLAG